MRVSRQIWRRARRPKEGRLVGCWVRDGDGTNGGDVVEGEGENEVKEREMI